MDINYQEIQRYMGIVNKPLDEKLKADIDKCFIDIKDIINPMKLTAEYDIEHTDKGVKLSGTDIEFNGNLIKNSLKDCKKIILLIATLTNNAENLIIKYSTFDMYLTIVLDACLTYYIEAFCDETEQSIKEDLLKNNLYATPRFSCGYGDFDIKNQGIFIKLLKADKYLGIQVNQSSMLIPNKSVTAIIGVSDVQKDTQKSKCYNCSKQCIYREIKNK